MDQDKSNVISDIATMLLENNKAAAKSIICQLYPHTYYEIEKRTYPIAKGGEDDEKNWVTTSMKNNSIKSNYTIDEIHWSLYPKGDISNWDGLTMIFLQLVERDTALLKDPYIKSWYKVSKLFEDRLLENKDLIKTDF